MKKILKYLLIVLLWVNGITAIASGIKILHHLQYGPWLNDLLYPGMLLFILLGIVSITVTFFSKKHPLILASCALVEGMCLVLAFMDLAAVFHRVFLFCLLPALEGLTLIITAIFLITMNPATVKTR